jgi:transposase
VGLCHDQAMLYGESQMDNQIQIPLNLPDVRVLEAHQTLKSEWLIRVESLAGGTTCRKCGERITEFHGLDAPLRLRHLPLFEVPVYLELRPKRYRCRRCDGGPTTTEQPSWYQRRSPNTTAYEQWLLRILINSTVSDVSHKLQVSEATVTGVLERWIETSVNWDAFSAIAIIGIDEISLKRGHRDFVAIITTKTALGVQVLAVLGNRKKETVLAFLMAIPSHLKQTVTTVCSDMYQGYVNAAHVALPHAQVVVDRFHVAQAYRNGADAVRKRELKRLKLTLPKAKYALLKGVMWPFRKRPADLQPDEKTQLNRLFVASPELEQAYTLREQLTDIFDHDHTKDTATTAIKAWCQRVRTREIREFDGFLTTLDNWLDEITNYFLERQSSGFVEGFNNRIKVLKRRCYGIFDVKRLFQRLTLDVNGNQRFGAGCPDPVTP